MNKKYYIFFIGMFGIIFYTFSSALNPAQITKTNKTNDFVTVDGRVTFSDMTGARALVRLINEYDSSIYEDTTDSEGYFKIENVQTTVREIINQEPDEFSIYSNYPNPVGDDTIIPFRTMQYGEVTIIIYNILGEEVDKRTYLMEAGLHGVRYVPKGAGGVQFYKVISGGKGQVGKFVTLDAFAGGGLKEEVIANLSGNHLNAISLSKTDRVENSLAQLYTVCVQSPDSEFNEILEFNVPIVRDTTLNFMVNRITEQTLVLGTDTLHFDTDQNQLGFTIENGGTDILSWSIAGDAAWLMFYAPSGNTANGIEQIAVAVNRVGLTAGLYHATLTITSNGGTSAIGVSMEVSPISLSTTDIHFTTSDTTHNFYITNCDTGSFDWHISVTEDWILVDPQSGTTTTEIDTIHVTIDENYSIADSTIGSIIVSPGLSKSSGFSGSGSSQIDVTNPDYTQPRLGVDGMAWAEFRCRHQTENAIYISNKARFEGGDPLSWIATANQGWIGISPNSGEISYMDGTHINVSINTSGFERGKLYDGQMTVSSNAGFKQFLLWCYDPIHEVYPKSLDFGSDKTSQLFAIYATGATPLIGHWISWTASVDQNWMSISDSEGQLSGSDPQNDITVSVDRSGLSPGEYNGTVTVQGECCDQRPETRTVDVTMVVPSMTIDYNHEIINYQGGFNLTTMITGQVPFEMAYPLH